MRSKLGPPYGDVRYGSLTMTDTSNLAYFAERALQEAIRAIDAKPGAPRRAHERMTQFYSARVIEVLNQVPSTER